MADIPSLIAQHATVHNALHARVHATFRQRDLSDEHAQVWRDACAEFHAFRSDVDRLLDQATPDAIATNPARRRFAFDFLSADPIYFRSGYAKERLLRGVKRLDLTEAEKAILREVILRRIRTGALREFRKFCQLIPKIQSDGFADDLRHAARSDDPAVRRRATFALRYVARAGG